MSSQDTVVKRGKLRAKHQQDSRHDNSESSEAESEPTPTTNQKEKEDEGVCIQIISNS